MKDLRFYDEGFRPHGLVANGHGLRDSQSSMAFNELVYKPFPCNRILTVFHTRSFRHQHWIETLFSFSTMRVVFQSLVLAILPMHDHAINSPFDIEQRSRTSVNLTLTEMIIELGPKLSANSSISAQNYPRWFNATERWQSYTKRVNLPAIQLLHYPSFRLTEVSRS